MGVRLLERARSRRAAAVAETALRTSGERFRALFTNSLVGICITDLEGRLLETNEAYARMLGYTVEELRGRPFAEFTHPEDVEENLRRFHAIETGTDSFRMKGRYLRKDGAVMWVDISARLVRDADGRPEFRFAIAVDISERKRVEEALRASEARLRAMFERSRVPMCLCLPDGTYIEANRAYQELVGYSEAELRQMAFTDVTHPDDLPANLAAVEEAFAGGTFRIEKRYVRKDGQIVWVDLSSAPIPSPDGSWFGFALAIDLTARKALEEQLLHAQKMEAVGLLAGGIAHDFNNLLTAIGGYSELVLAGLSSGSPLRPDVEEIARAGERAALLTQQLLAFGRKQVLRPTILDLGEVVGELESMLRRVIGEDVELVTELSPTAGPVSADRGQLEQVIVNLAVNARDAMPAGGRLTIGAGVAELAENGSASAGVPPGRYAMLTVRDTGTGMDAETRRRVFEPFFTTKEQGRGRVSASRPCSGSSSRAAVTSRSRASRTRARRSRSCSRWSEPRTRPDRR